MVVLNYECLTSNGVQTSMISRDTRHLDGFKTRALDDYWVKEKSWNLFFSIPGRSHTAKVSINFLALNGMKKAHHPPCSPHMRPSAFFLFGYVKRNLMGYRAEHLSELLVRIQVVLKIVPGETLVEVCSSGWNDCNDVLTWIEGVQKELNLLNPS
jgi:hypothetical protein